MPNMTYSAGDHRPPDVFDFVQTYLDDERDGTVRPLAQYLARFPDHADEIAREYLVLRERPPATEIDDDALDDSDTTAVVGPFRVLESLGRGGQATVDLAIDTRVGREVALKRIYAKGGMVSQARLSRFRREAEAVSRLQHQGICRVFEVDFDCEVPWIAMERVDGNSLAESIDAARGKDGVDAPRDHRHDPPCVPVDGTELRRLLLFVERAARALHAAHQAGVVHRDVKPSNIMVGPTGRPVVVDFGLAQVEELDAKLTLTGEVFGTPAYMSPEQLTPGSGPVDARSDVYSLAVTLYECLTLTRPYQKSTRHELRDAILTEKLPNVTELNPRVPRDLRIVLETALDREVDRRYANCVDFAEDLRRVREYEPIAARPASAWIRLRRWSQRHPYVALSSTLLFAFLVTGLVIANVLLAELRAAQRHSDGYRLATLAHERVDTQPELGGLLGLAAREMIGATPNPILDSALRRAAWTVPGPQIEASWIDTAGDTVAAVQADHRAVLIWNDSEWATPTVIDSAVPLQPYAALDRSGELVCAATTSGEIQVWRVTDGDLLASHPISSTGALSECALSASHVAVGTDAGMVEVWSLDRGAKLWSHELSTGERMIRCGFSPNGELLAVWGADYGHQFGGLHNGPRNLLVLAVDSGKEVCRLPHSSRIRWPRFDRAGRQLLTACSDGYARIFDLDDPASP